MLKKISKSLLSLLLIILTISSLSVCYATNTAVTTSETQNTIAISEGTEEATQTEETEIKNDLYFFDNNIVIDNVIYGNVYAFGNKVDVKAKIEGNLFVFANELNLNESYVAGSIYACANSINYNGAASYIYMMSNKLEMTYNSYVIRDAKIITTNAIIKAAIGRDMDLLCNNVSFGEGEDIPLFYGNLRYTANKEVEIPENAISNKENIIYTSPLNFNLTSIVDMLIGFGTAIVTVLALYIILNKVTPNFAGKFSNIKFSALKLLKAFGIGLATIIIVLIFDILLIGTGVGAKLAILLSLLFAALCLISVPILTISITNTLKPVLKLEKNSMFYLVLILVSIILYGLELIPFVGAILGLIIKLIAIGLIIDIYLPHKELTDEEIEAKKKAQEDKEKRKQEKLEAKAAKKQEKAETKKESKKESKKETKKKENKD